MELTSVYLGNLEGKKFVEIVDWCCDKLGTYGVGWHLDWEKHTVYMNDRNALFFALKWS